MVMRVYRAPLHIELAHHVRPTRLVHGRQSPQTHCHSDQSHVGETVLDTSNNDAIKKIDT